VQLYAGHVDATVQHRQRRRQRVGAIDFYIAINANYQNSGAMQITGNVEQQVERAAVGVVEVLEHDQ
jgi:hypothetical protein